MAGRSKNRELIQGVNIPFGSVSISFGPIHPYEALLSDKDLPKLRDKISVYAYDRSFPESIAKPRTVQGGISYFEHRKPSDDYNYLEVNKFGYLFYKEDMGEQAIAKGPNGEPIVGDQRLEVFRILRAIDLHVNCARKLYATTEYQGNLRLTVQADKLLKIPIRPIPSPGRWNREDIAEMSVDDQLVWFQEWSMTELNDFELRSGKIIRFGSEIAFSFGFPKEDQYIRQMLIECSPR